MSREEQREALDKFFKTCQIVLEQNMDAKSGWDRCNPWSLFEHLQEEVSEVRDELSLTLTEEFSLEKLKRECADVANMVMMVCDQVERLSEEGWRLSEPSKAE